MTNKVVHLNNIGTVIFSKNKRSKNIKISVKPDKTVRVSFPYYCPAKEVAAFVHKSEPWIINQQNKFDARKIRLAEGDEIKTKLHTIRFQSGIDNQIKKHGENVIVYCRDFNSDEVTHFIDYGLTEIYRFEAKKLLPARLEVMARKFDFSYNKVTIRNNKRNWGSCSSKNNISLNLQMMKLPNELIDYILVHELVHTEIKNHGPGFWRKMDLLTNFKAKELAKKVKQFSTYTL